MTEKREEHEGSDNLICFGFVIDMHENHDEEAVYRILDGFIKAVEAEGGCAGGGTHPYGTNPMCADCGPPTVCFDCGKELSDE